MTEICQTCEPLPESFQDGPEIYKFNPRIHIPELAGGTASDPDIERILNIESQKQKGKSIAPAITMYAMELCGLVPSEEELEKRVSQMETTLNEAEKAGASQPELEMQHGQDLSKIRLDYERIEFLKEMADHALVICSLYSDSEREGKLKYATRNFSVGANQLKTIPPVLKVINKMEKSNMIGLIPRRLADGIFRVMYLTLREEHIPVPGVDMIEDEL